MFTACALDVSGGITESLFDFWKRDARTFAPNIYLTFDSMVRDAGSDPDHLGYPIGAGGTEFDAPIQYALMKSEGECSVIMFTDGVARYPSRSSAKIVWRYGSVDDTLMSRPFSLKGLGDNRGRPPGMAFIHLYESGLCAVPLGKPRFRIHRDFLGLIDWLNEKGFGYFADGLAGFTSEMTDNELLEFKLRWSV